MPITHIMIGANDVAKSAAFYEKAMERLSKNWRPWRTVAARLFWTHEDAIRREKREAEKLARAQKARARTGKA